MIGYVHFRNAIGVCLDISWAFEENFKRVSSLRMLISKLQFQNFQSKWSERFRSSESELLAQLPRSPTWRFSCVRSPCSLFRGLKCGPVEVQPFVVSPNSCLWRESNQLAINNDAAMVSKVVSIAHTHGNRVCLWNKRVRELVRSKFWVSLWLLKFGYSSLTA